MTDLTYDCLERMDQLIHQSSKGVHLLFDKSDIVIAISDSDPALEENTVEKLKLVQDILYKFIQTKSIDEKQAYIKNLSRHEYTLLIRAYFKIVDNSILNKMSDKH